MNTVIVTRHHGAADWLSTRHGITGEVIAHATPDTVRGRIVYGVLPLHLAAIASEVWSVDLPELPAELRGQELTPEQMDAAGARLVGYAVHRLTGPGTLCPITGEPLDSAAPRFVVNHPQHPCDRCHAPQPNGEGNICCACAGELDRIDQE